MARITRSITRTALAFAAVLVLAAAPALGVTVTWNGSEDDLWTNAANWTRDPAGLPGNSDDVEFGATGAGLVDLNGSQTSRSATFTSASDYTIGEADDQWTFGTNNVGINVQGTGNVTIDADLVVNGNRQFAATTSVVSPTGPEARTLTLNGTVTSNGTLRVNGPLTLVLGPKASGSGFTVSKLRWGTSNTNGSGTSVGYVGGATLASSDGTLRTLTGSLTTSDGGDRRVNFTGGDFNITGGWDVAVSNDGNLNQIIHTAATRTVTFAGDLTRSNLSTTTMSLVGDGKLVLNGANYNWTGAINVGATIVTGTTLTPGTATNKFVETYLPGHLIINSTVIAGGGDVNVGTDSTLGGTGTITRNVNVATGGKLAPGQSPGTLNIVGDVTLASGFILNWEYGALVNDLVNITGTLDLSAANTIASTINLINAGGTLQNGDILFATTGGITGVDPGTILNWTILGGEGLSAVVDGSNVILVIPEPATVLLALAGGLLILPYRGRRGWAVDAA